MKILVVAYDFPPKPGGVASFVHNVCFQLCERGHGVDVLTGANEEINAIGKLQSYRIYRYSQFKRLSSLKSIVQTICLHRSNLYNVLFLGHFMTTHALGVLALHKVTGMPYVILSHGNDLIYSVSTWADELVARLLMRDASLMLGNSRFTLERIREAGYKGPVDVLNPGVNPTRFHPGVDTTKVRHLYKLEGRRVLFSAARLVAKKNVDGLLRALPTVIEQVPNVLYLVAGDGEERGRLEALRNELGLQPYVRFLGYIENRQLPALYCASDLFVMPTRGIESFGISFIEANACGVPVIAGGSGGTVDAVVDGVTGLIVDQHNVDAIAVAITRLLTDRKLARQLGENGRQRVERELSWEIVGERLEGCLKKVIEWEQGY